jgi:hypothetical protein
MYSGAMPIMYLIGLIHFTLAYWVYKYLLIDYFRKSWNFTEEIPFYALSLMKYVLFIHMCMIIFMYTNKRLLTPAKYGPIDFYLPLLE